MALPGEPKLTPINEMRRVYLSLADTRRELPANHTPNTTPPSASAGVLCKARFFYVQQTRLPLFLWTNCEAARYYLQGISEVLLLLFPVGRERGAKLATPTQGVVLCVMLGIFETDTRCDHAASGDQFF